MDGKRSKQSLMNQNKNNTLFVGLIIIVLFIVILIVLSFGGCNNELEISNTKNDIWDIVIDDNANEIISVDYDKLRQELNKKVDESSINISMNSNPVFENGESAGNLMITNNEINQFYQVIEIYLDKTGERIYCSDAIPVGKQISYDYLDLILEAGEYECTAYFNAIKSDGTYVGKAGAKIKITVLS